MRSVVPEPAAEDVVQRLRLLGDAEDVADRRAGFEVAGNFDQTLDQRGGFGAKDDEIARLRGDMDRLKAEAQAKIAQAQERIKELNQKLIAAGAGSGSGMKR